MIIYLQWRLHLLPFSFLFLKSLCHVCCPNPLLTHFLVYCNDRWWCALHNAWKPNPYPKYVMWSMVHVPMSLWNMVWLWSDTDHIHCLKAPFGMNFIMYLMFIFRQYVANEAFHAPTDTYSSLSIDNFCVTKLFLHHFHEVPTLITIAAWLHRGAKHPLKSSL